MLQSIAKHIENWYYKIVEKKYEVILFDLDDTLVDNNENIKVALFKTFSHFKFDCNEEIFQNWQNYDKSFWRDYINGKIQVPEKFSQSRQLFVSYLRGLRFSDFLNVPIEKAIEINEYFIKMLRENVVPINGACEVIKYLSKKYTVVVASNGPSDAIPAKLSKIGCEKEVKYYFSSDMTKSTSAKPHKEYFDELFEYIGHKDKTKVLLVGDDLINDVQGGLNYGIDTCFFDRNCVGIPSQYKANYVIKNLKELIELL